MDPGAQGLVDSAVVTVSRSAAVKEALRRSRARGAAVIELGREGFALSEDLARAETLGLGALGAARLTRPLPVLDARAREAAVRRALAAGAPAVVVRSGRRTLGAVTGAAAGRRYEPALAARFAGRLSPALRALVDVVASCAAAEGVRAFLVGGVVRDALDAVRCEDGRDVDVVIEGDGVTFAQALGRRLGAEARSLVVHDRFLTASLATSGGVRVDIATARSERYEERGALPRVVPSTIEQDLARRDFTVNAMAVELGSGAFELLDPFGGRDDLQRRRLRVLHPLSFVEDPTRLFRAARYASRLGLTLEPWSRRGRALALALVPYPALSGSRLLAELELIVADRRPGHALRALGAAGAFRLLDPDYRFTRTTAARLAGLDRALAWARARGLRAAPIELALSSLLADQPPALARAVIARLGLTGEPAMRLERALDAVGRARPAAAGSPPSARAHALRGLSELELAWLRLAGTARQRAAVEWFVDEARGAAPQLRGDDVVGLGVPPGPDVARVLAALRDARLDGGLADRDAEIAYVRDWIEGRHARKER